MRSITKLPFSRNHAGCMFLVWIAACNIVGGIQEPILDNSVGFAGSGLVGGGGAGGSAGSSMKVCEPMATEPCYSGPSETQNIGNCKAGTRTCLPSGTAFGECVGEVVPAAAEDCMAVGDEDCNGLQENIPVCGCTPGMTVECATGAPGICAKGSGKCADDGKSVAVGTCMSLKNPTFDTCATPEDDDCDGVAIYECTGKPHLNGFGTDNPNTALDDRVLSVAAMSDDSIVVAGFVQGQVTTGTVITSGNGYVARIASDGTKTTWSQTFPSTVYSKVISVAVGPDDSIVVVGQYEGTITFPDATMTTGAGGPDIFVVKLDGTNGAHQWHKTYGVTNAQWADDVVVDAAGKIFITGTIDTVTIDFGDGPITPQNDDLFILSLETDGTFRWSKSYKAQNVQHGMSIVALPSGGIVVATSTTWGIPFGANCTTTNKGKGDIALAKLTDAGECVWAKMYGESSSEQTARGLAVTKYKNGQGMDVDSVVLTGIFETKLGITGSTPYPYADNVSPNGAFVAEFDGLSGNCLRALTSGTTGGTFGSSVAVDGAGDVILTGWTNKSLDFGGPTVVTSAGFSDAYVAKLDGKTWAPRWIRTFTGPNAQTGLDIAVDAPGRIIVGGSFTTEILFGGLAPDGAAKGGFDGYVVRLDP